MSMHGLLEVELVDWNHFPTLFIDEMLDRLSKRGWYWSFDSKISIAPEDQDKTNFNCPYFMFAFKRILFGIFNALETFQHCMVSIFSHFVEDSMEVFMDGFLVVCDTF